MDNSHVLLGLLQYKSSYGYDLKQLYDSLFGSEKALAYGQVYATLARLVRDGKAITIESSESSGGPDRKRYEITNSGSMAIQQWLSEPVEPEPQLQATLYAKVMLALTLKTPANTYLTKQRHVHVQHMRDLTRRKHTVDPPQRLLIDYALFHIEADLHWIDLTEKRLTTLTQEVL